MKSRVTKSLRLEASIALREDHSLKPSTCPHAAEMGALREAARNNIIHAHTSLKEMHVF